MRMSNLMKRLTVFLLLCLAVCGTAYATGTRINGKRDGDILTVNVSLTGNTGINALDYQLSYNAEALECIGAEAGSMLGGFTAVNPKKPGKILMAAAAAYPWEGDGVILTARFRVIGSGAFRINGTGEAALVGNHGVESDDVLPEERLTEPDQVRIRKPGKIRAGKTYRMKADCDVTWRSGNTKVATITRDGLLRAKKAGKVKLTAAAVNGITATITVRVTR